MTKFKIDDIVETTQDKHRGKIIGVNENVKLFGGETVNMYDVKITRKGWGTGIKKGDIFSYKENNLTLLTDNPAGQSIDQAKKSYKEFTWRNPDDIFKGQLPIYKGEQLIYIGQVTKLWYKSDKFDRVQRIHCHDFKRPHMVFTNKARTLLYIYPCVINSRGIID